MSCRSIRRARSRAGRCSATGYGSPTTSSTPACTSARWGRAATSAGSPRRRCRRCSCSTPPGKTSIFVETVGAGQSEVEVTGIADTVVLVLMPGSGDSVQALKAGIMEIPDVIAVNKMEHPAAKTMLNEVRSIVALAEPETRPAILLTEALTGENVPALLGGDRGASVGARERRPPRGAAPQEPLGGGVRRRVESCECASARRGRRGSGAPARPRAGREPASSIR